MSDEATVDLGIEGIVDARPIGSGGFATVYAATEEDFRRTVAVKVLHSVDAAGRRRFERERVVMGQLSEHPNVVTPYRFGYTNAGNPFLVMEYLRGGSLRGVIDRDGPMPWQTAVGHIEQIADALGHGHQQGVLHQDVKPANILLTGSGAAKLSDFGIARVVQATATTQLAFTIAHSAPETFMGGSTTRDQRSDLYSLASTLYELLTGRTPHQVDAADDTAMAHMIRVMEHTVPAIGPEVAPVGLNRFLQRGLAKEPTERPSDHLVFIEELRRAGDEPVGDDEPDGSATVIAPLRSNPQAGVPSLDPGRPARGPRYETPDPARFTPPASKIPTANLPTATPGVPPQHPSAPGPSASTPGPSAPGPSASAPSPAGPGLPPSNVDRSTTGGGSGPTRVVLFVGAGVVATIALLAGLGAFLTSTGNSSGDGVAAGSEEVEPSEDDTESADANTGDDNGSTNDGTGQGADEPAAVFAEVPETVVPAGAVEGGTVVWVHDQQPPSLHLDDPSNNLTITSWIREGLVEGLFGVDADTSYYPELLAEEPTVTEVGDGVRIDYTLRPGLRWSDGAPLTSADVAYTHDILTEGCPRDPDGSIAETDGSLNDGCVYLTGTRAGLDRITGFRVVSETEFTVEFAEFYGGWRELYRNVFAAHAFGDDAAEVNNNLMTWTAGSTVLPSSGPLVLEQWDQGVSMSLIRNDNYHGSVSPDSSNPGAAIIDGVRIDFVGSTADVIDGLLTGNADIMMASIQADFEALADSSDFTLASSPGPIFEHWGFNLLNPHLARPEVREAIAYAIDKRAMVEALYTPLYGSAIPPDGLGNTYWMTNQTAYVDNQARYAGAQIDSARERLEEAGYAAGADGVYEHPSLGRLTLRVGTTGGNTLRERQQEILAEQVAAAGIEIVIDNRPGGEYFLEGPFSAEALAAASSGGAEGDSTIWDIAQFAWVGQAWPGGQSLSYASGSGSNPYGFASTIFDALSTGCDTIVDDDIRDECYNEADRHVTTLDKGDDGLFMIPLSQKPAFYGHRTDRFVQIGVAPDLYGGGPLTNATDFAFTE